MKALLSYKKKKKPSSLCSPQGGGWPIRLIQSIDVLFFFLKACNIASAMLTSLEPLGDADLMKKMVTV